MEQPRLQRLPDGRRIHLWHGPIDLVIEACGPAQAVAAAYAGASARFATILDELCAELPLLRSGADRLERLPAGSVARRMLAAVAPFAADTFITPMAAVAGAVAQEVLAAMRSAAGPGLTKAYVNNGGDIALHLAPDAHFDVGIADDPRSPRLRGTARIDGRGGVRGVATSGWRGRSFSLGIADAVTVLAGDAAGADAAATLIANAVDLPGHPSIRRASASSRQIDSDLGERLVTIGVGTLQPDEVRAALRRGLVRAEGLLASGHILAAALFLAGHTVSTGMSGLLVNPTDLHGHAGAPSPEFA